MVLKLLRHIDNEEGNFSVEVALIIPVIFMVVVLMFSLICGRFFKYAATIQMNQAGYQYQVYDRGLELRLNDVSKAKLLEVDGNKALLERYDFHKSSLLGVTRFKGEAGYDTLDFALTTANGESTFHPLYVEWEGIDLDYQIVLLNLEMYLDMKAMLKDGVGND